MATTATLHWSCRFLSRGNSARAPQARRVLSVATVAERNLTHVDRPPTKPGAARAPPLRPPGRVTAQHPAKPAPPAKSAAAPAGPAVTLKIAQPERIRASSHSQQTQQERGQGAFASPAGKKAAERRPRRCRPPTKKLAGANANKADKMAAAETGKPQPTSFLAMLRAEIQKVMPKKTEDAKGFMKGGDREKLEGAMTGNVQQQKGEAHRRYAGCIRGAARHRRRSGKEVTPLAGEGAPPAPVPVDAGAGMPAPKPAQETSLEQGKKDTDKLLTDAEVTTRSCRRPTTRGSLPWSPQGRGRSLRRHRTKQYRRRSRRSSPSPRPRPAATRRRVWRLPWAGRQGFEGCARAPADGQGEGRARAQEGHRHIQSIFDRTKASVDKKLASLDDEVSRVFDRGTDAAIAKMKDYVESRFDDRYSGIIGKGRWLKDKLLPLPGSVKSWFDQAHKVFLQELDALVVRVAELVERRLKEARTKSPRARRNPRVCSGPAGRAAGGRKGRREGDAGAVRRAAPGRGRQEERSRPEARAALQGRIGKGREGAARTEGRAQEPVRAGARCHRRNHQGIARFQESHHGHAQEGQERGRPDRVRPDRLPEECAGRHQEGTRPVHRQHLDPPQAGFMAWLFGSIAETGVEVPKDLSLGSILKLVLQVLGLTYARLRAKAVKLLGERAVAVIEQVAKFIWCW